MSGMMEAMRRRMRVIQSTAYEACGFSLLAGRGQGRYLFGGDCTL